MGYLFEMTTEYKTYVMNWDGHNYAAVSALSKKDAIARLGTTGYQFTHYGTFTRDELPSVEEVYFKPMTDWANKYPWRKEKYYLRHDEKRNSYYE